MKNKFIDMTGKKYGRWTVISYHPDPNCNAAMWLCRCECGTEKVKRGDAIRHGKSKSCGCLQKELAAAQCTKYGGPVARNCLIHNYRSGARDRGLEFSLSFEECEKLFSGDCNYCGSPPSQHATFGNRRQYPITYNGIDRVDNSIGYVSGNVVSCCKFCNSAKSDRAISEFREWANRLAKNLDRWR